MKITDMPKLESPFKRENIKGKHVCTPKLEEEFAWIFDPEKVIATEKFDGTNVSVLVEEGAIKAVFNRTNRIDLWKSGKWFYEGIKRAIDEKKFKPEMLDDGQYFGELIGEKIQGNPYNVKGHLWLPLVYLKKHYAFKFYPHWLKETEKEDNFKRTNSLFKELKSLWFRKKGQEQAPEGIVFHHKNTNQMCKLRLDMFDWHEGKPHKWYLPTKK